MCRVKDSTIVMPRIDSETAIEAFRAITRYVGYFEFWENGFKDLILQTVISKPFDHISTSCLKHHVSIIVFNEIVT